MMCDMLMTCATHVSIHVLPGACGAGALTSQMKLSARPRSACMTSQPGACGASTSTLAMLSARVYNDEVERPRVCAVYSSCPALAAPALRCTTDSRVDGDDDDDMHAHAKRVCSTSCTACSSPGAFGAGTSIKCVDRMYAALHDIVALHDCVDGDVMTCKPGAFGAGT